ncbi:hypothetical protein E2C01_002708 [Portunus trituberculatus]|uniref:Uncharacterized protein n=1 Tax=Portunus trituberculatus TaxID=210409 RepID=A0A5B7CMM4_PORTR|nr:hypothetical protein [Portunus trituberculatus]
MGNYWFALLPHVLSVSPALLHYFIHTAFSSCIIPTATNSYLISPQRPDGHLISPQHRTATSYHHCISQPFHITPATLRSSHISTATHSIPQPLHISIASHSQFTFSQHYLTTSHPYTIIQPAYIPTASHNHNTLSQHLTASLHCHSIPQSTHIPTPSPSHFTSLQQNPQEQI